MSPSTCIIVVYRGVVRLTQVWFAPPPHQNSIDLLEQHGIAIWGPMPSLSAHLNKGFDDADAPTSSSAFLPEQSLYFDYFDFAKALLKQAAHTRPPVVLGP